MALDRWRSGSAVLVATGSGNRAGTVTGAVVAAVALGALIGADRVEPVFVVGALAAAVGAFLTALSGWTVPALIVVLSAAAVDALPGPTLIGGVPHSMALVLPVLAWAGWSHVRRLPFWLLWACGGLALWSLIAALRAWAIGAPLGMIINDNIDLSLYPLLVVGYAAVGLNPILRRQLLIGFGVLAVWVAAVNTAGALGLVEPVGGFFAHAYNAADVGGIVRLYAWSSEYVAAAVPFALGAALMAPKRGHRLVGAFVLLLALAQVLLGLGRVQWAGTAVALLLMLALWGRPYLRRIGTLAVVTTMVVLAAVAAGPLREPVQQVGDRVSSIFASSNVRAGDRDGDTLAFRDRYKQAIRDSMTTTEWAVGHGFLPRGWYYFPPDAIKSLRNSDLGWYNALNTMGLIGVVLIFVPVIGILATCWQARRAAPDERWIAFGGMGYALYAVLASQTLVVLFSPTIAVAAAALGLSLASALSARTG